MRETWSTVQKTTIETPQKQIDFMEEIEQICKKYNFSISHEDGHGAFEIIEFDEWYMAWLKSAHIDWM